MLDFFNNLQDGDKVGLLVAAFALFGVLGSALISAIVTGLFILINGIFERKNRMQSEIFKSAMESWKHQSDLLFEIAEKTGKPTTYYPFNSFLIDHYFLLEMLNKSKKGSITKDDFISYRNKSEEISEWMEEQKKAKDKGNYN